MEQKDYLETFKTDFHSVETATTFVSIMSKYIAPEQINVDGSNVEVHANNKAESWFLTLFTLNVTMQRLGLPMPEDMQSTMVLLASYKENPEQANAIAERLDSEGMSQLEMIKLIHEISN